MNGRTASKMFLLPTCLAADTEPSEMLPAGYFPRIKHLQAFIAENPRSARRFLRRIGYQTDFNEVLFIELNEHTRADCMEAVLEAQGIAEATLLQQDMGVLSEAGLPCVADPGALAVAWAHRKGLQVVPLSGPSSIFMALMASGFNGQNFQFHGYLPASPKERAWSLRKIETATLKTGQTQIFIETPYRSQAMFQSIIENCQPATLLCIASEIASESESIRTLPVSQWKKEPARLEKRNTVFLLCR